MTYCPYCYNTGTKCVANGEDDYDLEICDCKYGDKLQQNYGKKSTIRVGAEK